MITRPTRRIWNRAALLALGTILSLGAARGTVLRGSPPDERNAVAPVPQAFATFAYLTSRPATPACDSAPVIREAAPLEVPAILAPRPEDRPPGRLVVHVDAAGAVTRVSPPKDAGDSELTAFLARALKEWRFHPLLRNGIPTETEFTLDYSIKEVAIATAASSGKQICPPVLVYRIVPAHPPEFTLPLTIREVDTRIMAPSGGTSAISQGIPPPTRPLIHTEEVDVPWLKGAVTVRFKVDADGVPQDIRVMESSCAHLDAEAYSAVRYWRYRPMHMDGRPSASMLNEIIWFPVLSSVHMPEFIRPPVRQPKGALRWDEPPAYLRLALPVYPEGLVQDGREGNATVEVRLAEDGTVVEARPTDSTRPEFGLALQAAVFASSFTPARKDGRAIATAFPIFAKFARERHNIYEGRVRLPALRLIHDESLEPVPAEKLDSPLRVLIQTQPVFRSTDGAASEVSVELELIVDSAGRGRSPRIVSASRPEFGYAAVQACATWLFEPPTVGGKPAAARVRITLSNAAPAPRSP